MVHTASALLAVGAMSLLWGSREFEGQDQTSPQHEFVTVVEIELRLPDLTVSPNRGARQICVNFGQPRLFPRENATS